MKTYKEYDVWNRLYGSHYDCTWVIVPAYGANLRSMFVRKEFL